MSKATKVGDRIYNGGDVCNTHGTFVVTEIENHPRWGTTITMVEEPDAHGYTENRTIRISPSNISDVYLGHGGTRFAPVEAVAAWRAQQEATLRTELEAMDARRAR